MKKPQVLATPRASEDNVKTGKEMNVMSNTNTVVDLRQFIEVKSGKPFTTSMHVAEAFDKQHKDVLRKLEGLECSSDFRERNFTLTHETIIAGPVQRKSPIWEMTKDGFMFLVMGFTGKKAAAVKEGYIAAFNWMAEQLGKNSTETVETIVGKAIGADGVRMLATLKRGKVANLPVEFRRKALAKMGQQLNTAFGVRQAADIPLEKLDAARNFIAAYAIEGEWLPKEEKPNQQLDIHFPVDYLSGRRPGMLHPRNESTDYLNVSLFDLIEPFDSPCEAILSRLGKAGYNVDGAWWEIRTYRNKIGQLRNLLENFRCNFEGAQQYVIKRGIAA